MKKRIAVILIIVLISPILYWGISFAKCEILTTMYGHHFSDGYYRILDDIAFFKVIGYSDSNATVYYVNKNKTAGVSVNFTSDNGEWTYDSWDAVWSEGGTADDILFPYWWHFLYPALYAEWPQSIQ